MGEGRGNGWRIRLIFADLPGLLRRDGKGTKLKCVEFPSSSSLTSGETEKRTKKHIEQKGSLLPHSWLGTKFEFRTPPKNERIEGRKK